MNLVSKPSENQFNSRGKLIIDFPCYPSSRTGIYLGQDVLPLDNNFPAFKLFPPRSDSIDNSNNRASPSNNGPGNNLKIVSPVEVDEGEFRPITVSPFRLFGTSATVSAVNSNNAPPKTPSNSSLKKFSSTTDKPRRKRTPKIDDNTDGQKVKRRRSEMTMNQKQLTLTELQTPITSEKKVNVNPDTSAAKVKRQSIGFEWPLERSIASCFCSDFFELSRNWLFSRFLCSK